MTTFSTPMQTLLIGLLIILAALAIFALVYGIVSHRFTDKIVATNMMGSLGLNIIVIFAIYLGQDYILDIAIVLALLSFLAVVVLCRVVTDHIFGQLRHMRDKQEGDLSKENISTAGTEGPRQARPRVLETVHTAQNATAQENAQATTEGGDTL